MAVAGFAPHEIELTQQGNTLIVSGQKKAEQEHREMLHQGLAYRSFKQTFNLADHVQVPRRIWSMVCCRSSWLDRYRSS